jgi:hypothetical protein
VGPLTVELHAQEHASVRPGAEVALAFYDEAATVFRGKTD